MALDPPAQTSAGPHLMQSHNKYKALRASARGHSIWLIDARAGADRALLNRMPQAEHHAVSSGPPSSSASSHAATRSCTDPMLAAWHLSHTCMAAGIDASATNNPRQAPERVSPSRHGRLSSTRLCQGCHRCAQPAGQAASAPARLSSSRGHVQCPAAGGKSPGRSPGSLWHALWGGCCQTCF